MVALTELLPASSSSSSSAGDLNYRYSYDAFISFRGVDTRNGFTNHLYNALVDAGISTFLDDEEIDSGEALKPKLESAIKSSRCSIVVLSQNYAFSSWCLDELVLILEQMRMFDQVVIPIFYDVDPSDVRWQKNSFGEAMIKHKKRTDAEENEEKLSELAQKMELWKSALTEVASLKGLDRMNRKETDLIKEVVDTTYRRLGSLLSHSPPLLIGMDDHTQFIDSWLIDGSQYTADILTIVGMGGIGKTSLAKYVFHYALLSGKFDKCSFIEGINARCNEHFNGLHNLQRQLCNDILGKIPLEANNVYACTSVIERLCARQKVLIVLDDVDNLSQVNALLGNKGFLPGSKIIITTKDASLTERCALFNSRVQPNHTKVPLNGLRESKALKLLCIHAFESQKPEEGYEDVSKQIVEYCEGHPLALKLLGGSLRKQDVAYWEAWIEVLKKEPHLEINNTLKMSYDSLPFENDKELFKHIACFFVGMDRDVTVTILDACGMDTRSGIRNLIDRSLIRIGRGNELMMHDLVQEMARYIVCNESQYNSPDACGMDTRSGFTNHIDKSLGRDNELMMHRLNQEMGRELVHKESQYNPRKRSRLWCNEESLKVLQQKKCADNLLGLSLDMKMLDKKNLPRSFELKEDSLSHMDNLKLLRLNYVQFNGHFKNFPQELRWLCMHGIPVKSIHFDSPMENLVALDVSYSNIESFDVSCSSNPLPPMRRQKLVGSCYILGSLKILDLSFCEQLHSLGGFSQLPALERLIVKNCISLMEVCESIGQCVELVHIDLSNCYKLTKVPVSIGNLKKIKTLLLDGCNLRESQIKISDTSLSDISRNSQTSSSAIPNDLKSFTVILPSSLIILSLANNNLTNKSFPKDFSCLSMLEELCLDYNPIVSMPICVRSLRRLEKLSMDNCEMLMSVDQPPRTLTDLSVDSDSSFRLDYETSIRKIKFHPEMSRLRFRGARTVVTHSPYEIDGMIKVQAMADVEEKISHSLGWTNIEFIKEGHLGTHTTGRESVESTQTQMYYEFGIFSTIYEGKQMPEWISCSSKEPSVSFTIPLSRNKLRGFNFLCVGRYASSVEACFGLPIIKVSNDTKNQTWIYKPYIEKVKLEGAYLSVLSHWMFGPNEMKDGDQITITVATTDNDRQLIMECGIGLAYDEEGKIEEEEDELDYYKSWNHIIGGDLSDFQVKSGEYILDYRNFRRISTETSSNYNSFIDNRASFKGARVAFQAFSQKKCEIVDEEETI